VPATRLRLREILERIGNDQPVSLQKRIDLQKWADDDQSVASWLRQALRRRHRSGPGDGIDRFLIKGWFGGAPGWLQRS